MKSPGDSRKNPGIRVYLNEAHLGEIDKVRGDRSRGAWISELVSTHLGTPRRRRIELVSEEPWPGLPEPIPPPPGTDLRSTRKGNHSLTRRLDINAQLRGLQALRLKTEGKSYDEIAAIIGYSSPDSARASITSVMQKYMPFEVQEYAKVYIGELLDSIELLREFVANPTYMMDIKGALVTDPDGRFMPDRNAQINALTEIRKTIESLRRQQGTDAPKKTETTVKADEELNERIQARLKVIAERLRPMPIAALPDEDIVEAEVVPEAPDEPDDDAPPSAASA
jgi:DNA-binding CsgD family transcriptional regulator